MLRKWAAGPAIVVGALLSHHPAFIVAESFDLEAIGELPVSFFSLIFWLMQYGADLLGPLLLTFLRRASVRPLLH